MIRTIELEATIAEDGKLTLNLPSDVPPGYYQVVVVIAGQQASVILQPGKNGAPLPKPHLIEWDTIPQNTTFSREELYEDAPY